MTNGSLSSRLCLVLCYPRAVLAVGVGAGDVGDEVGESLHGVEVSFGEPSHSVVVVVSVHSVGYRIGEP